MADQTQALLEAFHAYRTPDPGIVDKLPKGGTTLDYVGHAEITAILIEIDPLWSWEPVSWDENGGPSIVTLGKHVMLWARMTVLGKTLPCVGTVEVSKIDRGGEVHKELISDLIRNGAMRFGICVDLWAKDHPEADLPPAREPQSAPKQGHGKDSPLWQAVAANLRALDPMQRDGAVEQLIDEGLFEHKSDGNYPKLPFTDDQLNRVANIIVAWRDAIGMVCGLGMGTEPIAPQVTDTLSPAHPQHAIDTICYALECQPNEIPDDLDVAFWYLAEHADADEIDWRAAAKALHITPTGVLKAAKEVAEVLGVPAPKRLDDEDSPIMGNLAIELRAFLIKDSMGDPFPTKETANAR